jgi:tetratricopeptide (TPR) repeat protein
MRCYKCGCHLSEKNFCTGCGTDVTLYKKIIYTSNKFYNDGLEKAKVRDLSGAVSSLRQCLKLNKNHIVARNLLGLVYFERGEVVAALSEWVISKNIRNEKNIANDYIDMIQNNPGRLETYNQTVKKYNMALNYCRQDSLDLAVIQLKKVISLNPRFVQARQLLALLYMNSQEWDKAKRELDRAVRIDANNTTTLRYLKETEAMLPSEEEKVKKKKETVVYKSGNDTVIQPVTKKQSSKTHAIMNIIIGVIIGAGVAWFLVAPSKIQKAQSEMDEKYKVITEQLDVKTAQVDELTQQVNSLTVEKDNLSLSLDEERENTKIIEANTNLIEATLMYMNKTGDEMAIADELEMIDSDYLQDEATDSFKNLYATLKGNIGKAVAKASYDIGYEAYKAENYETAIEHLERAVDYDSTNGEALYNLGNSYNKSGNTERAVEIYQQVIQNFPNTEKARKSQIYIKEIRGE